MCPAFPHTQHFLSEGDLGPSLVPRLWYGALRVRSVNGPWFAGTGRLVASAITSASSLGTTSFIDTYWRYRLFANRRHCLSIISRRDALSSFFSFVAFTTLSRAAIATYGSKRAARRAITIWRVNKADSIADASFIFFHSSNSFFSAPVGCVTCYVECVTMSSCLAMYAGIWFWRVKSMCLEIHTKNSEFVLL